MVDLKSGTVETIELGRLNSAQKWAREALNAPVLSNYGGTSGGTAGGTVGETGVAGAATDPIVAAAKGVLGLGETVVTLGNSIQSGGELSQSLSSAGFSPADQTAVLNAMFQMGQAKSLPYYYGQGVTQALTESPGAQFISGMVQGATDTAGDTPDFLKGLFGS